MPARKKPEAPAMPQLDALPADRRTHPAIADICRCAWPMKTKKEREAVAKRHGVTLAYVDAVIEHYYPSHWFES